jgi:hypothetical protein
MEEGVELRESQGVKVRELAKAEALAVEHRNVVLKSHPQATYKPTAWEGIATHKPPTSHPHATLMRPSCDPHATHKPGKSQLIGGGLLGFRPQ